MSLMDTMLKRELSRTQLKGFTPQSQQSNTPELLLGAVSSSGLLQYPDVKLYNAGKMLKPSDRPTVPVRLYDDPKPIYDSFGTHSNPDATAVVGPKKDTIFVNRTKDAYTKDLKRLAGVLAHEQRHVTGGDEDEARIKELEVLKKLVGNWSKNPRLDYLQRYYGDRR